MTKYFNKKGKQRGEKILRKIKAIVEQYKKNKYYEFSTINTFLIFFIFFSILTMPLGLKSLLDNREITMTLVGFLIGPLIAFFIFLVCALFKLVHKIILKEDELVIYSFFRKEKVYKIKSINDINIRIICGADEFYPTLNIRVESNFDTYNVSLFDDRDIKTLIYIIYNVKSDTINNIGNFTIKDIQSVLRQSDVTLPENIK